MSSPDDNEEWQQLSLKKVFLYNLQWSEIRKNEVFLFPVDNISHWNKKEHLTASQGVSLFLSSRWYHMF